MLGTKIRQNQIPGVELHCLQGWCVHAQNNQSIGLQQILVMIFSRFENFNLMSGLARVLIPLLLFLDIIANGFNDQVVVGKNAHVGSDMHCFASNVFSIKVRNVL